MTQALIEEWKNAKAQESLWNAKRIELESQIYETHAKEIPEKGTYTTPEGMKITTGFTESWDDTELNTAYQQWPVETVVFPFSTTWKPDSKAIKVLRDSIPNLYRIIEPALTLKPKKPSFNIKE